MASVTVEQLPLPAEAPWNSYLAWILGNGEYFISTDSAEVAYDRALSTALSMEGAGPAWFLYAPLAKRLLGTGGYVLSADGGLSLHEALAPGGSAVAVSPDAALLVAVDYDAVGMHFYPLNAGGYGYGTASGVVPVASVMAALGAADIARAKIAPAVGGGTVVVSDRDGTGYAVIDTGALTVLAGDFSGADGGGMILERHFSPDTLTCVSVDGGSGALRCCTRTPGGLFTLTGTLALPANAAVLGITSDGGHCVLVSFGEAYDATVSYVDLATMEVVASASLEAVTDYGVDRVTAGTGSTYNFVAQAADGVRVYTVSLSAGGTVSAFWTAFIGAYETL